MHVLLVDDDPADLELLKNAISEISDKEFHISVARDKDEAIAAYAKHPISCALVDYYMKDTTGADLIDLLHSLPRYIGETGERMSLSDDSPLPVAVVTGSQSDEVKNRVKQTGALKVVSKSEMQNPTALDALFVELLKS